MNQISLTRGALLGTACLLLAISTSSAANAQNVTYPPGTNCQSLLPSAQGACIDQAERLNSGAGVTGGSNMVIPNSSGSNTVPTPGTNSNGMNSGTNVAPNGIQPNGTISPNAVTPNGTVSPNAVTPNGTVNPNAVGAPNNANPIIVPPASTDGTTGGTGTGTSAN